MEKLKLKIASIDNEIALYQLCRRYFTAFLIIFSGYILGWLGFSFSWILIALFIWIVRYKHYGEKHKKVNLQQLVSSDERWAISCAIKDLPSWVHFPVINYFTIRLILDLCSTYITIRIYNVCMCTVYTKHYTHMVRQYEYKF